MAKPFQISSQGNVMKTDRQVNEEKPKKLAYL